MYIRDKQYVSQNNNDNFLNEDYDNNNELDSFSEEDYGGIQDMDALIEAFFIDEISRMDDKEKENFFNSDGCAQLVEAGVLKRAAVVLGKNAELSRRTMMAVLQKAKENGDALWMQLHKNRIKEKQLLDALEKKYANSVKSDVKKAYNRFTQLHKATNLGTMYNKIKGIR